MSYQDTHWEVLPLYRGAVGVFYSPNWLGKIGSERIELGNKKTNVDHSNYSIGEISMNTEKSPGHLKRLTVNQAPVINYQLAWVV